VIATAVVRAALWFAGTRAGRLLGLAGAALMAVGYAYLRGRAAGRDSERSRQQAARLEAWAKRGATDEAVRRSSDSDNRRVLRRWSR